MLSAPTFCSTTAVSSWHSVFFLNWLCSQTCPDACRNGTSRSCSGPWSLGASPISPPRGGYTSMGTVAARFPSCSSGATRVGPRSAWRTTETDGYDMLWYAMICVWCGRIWYDTVRYYRVWYDRYGMVLYDMLWWDVIWCDMVWYHMIFCDMVWYGMIDMVWYYMICCDGMWYDDVIWCGIVWCYVTWYDTVWYCSLWYGVMWSDIVWYDLVWYYVISYVNTRCMILYGVTSYALV